MRMLAACSFYFTYEIGFNPLKPMCIGQLRRWAFCESKKWRKKATNALHACRYKIDLFDDDASTEPST